jgi:hypothetical protein
MGVKLGLRLFENRFLRIFPSKREEVVEGWRKLHNEELCNLNASQNTIRVIKSKRMRWTRLVARMGRRKIRT